MSIFNFFRRKKDKNITPEEFFQKYKLVMTDKQFDQLQDMTLELKSSMTLLDEEVEQLDKKLEEKNRLDELLTNTAQRNDEGKALEKAGDIESAIKIYEANIADGYPATYSFDRLMILYRKKKMFTDELRVLRKAIKIFTKENEKRFKTVFDKPENKSIKDDLQIGFETNTNVMGTNGFYAYCPYPLIKWIEREEKVNKLMNNK